jgi:DNA gyrase subunit A
VVTISHRGYIKRTPLNIYRSQRRGGKGRMGMFTREDDFVSQLYVASTHSYFLIFTTAGRAYWLKVHAIPVGSPSALGKAVVNLLQLGPEEKMATILAVREFVEGPSVVMATRRGLVKKTDLMAFRRPRSGGIMACTLEEGDELVGVALAEADQEIILGTRQGKVIRFLAAEVRDMGRGARGVKGLEVTGDDAVVGMEVVQAEGAILTVTERGFGKRTLLTDYPRHHRGGQGVRGLNITERNGPIISFLQAQQDDEVMLVTDGGKIVRLAVADIPVIGRVTQGVKLVDIEPEERLVSLAKVAEKSNGADADS